MQTQATRAANMEPIPGYRLQCLLGRGGFGEVWRCEAPGGILKAIKFVSDVQETDALHGELNLGAARERQALELIKTIRHPFILSVDRIELLGDDLVLVTELADQNLFEVLQDYRGQGKQGLPRAELLRYMREAAEALDLLNLEHGLQHLDVKPHNLFLINRHVKVGDFGLVSSLAGLHGQPDGAVHLEAISPLYAAPEGFLGKVTAFTDQYSLAITYHELLTGGCPFSGKNFRQLALQRLQGEPDLSRLESGDRAALQRALAREPRDRFPCCMDLIDALESGKLAAVEQPPAIGPTLPPMKNSTREVQRPGDMGSTRMVPTVGETTPAPEPDKSLTTTPGTSHLVGEDILTGYRFLECIGRLPLGEAWKVESGPENLKHIKLLGSYQADTEDNGTAALRRLKEIRHVGLVPQKVIRDKNQRVAIVSPWIEANLAEHLVSCKQDGLEGIPREELLDYMNVVASLLDELREQYELRHLGLSPGLMMVNRGELLLADFGLCELLWRPLGHSLAALNPRYSAPELFCDEISDYSDQYSLALIYAELRTGTHVFRNLNPRQMAKVRLRGQPDLRMLTTKERFVLHQALHADPEQRFGSCREMVEALSNPTHQGAVSTRTMHKTTRMATPRAAETGESLRPRIHRESMTGFAPLLDQVTGIWEVRTMAGYRYLLRPGETILQQGFFSGTPEMLRLKLKAFRQEWDARVVVQESHRHVFHIFEKGGLFRRWWGRERGIEIDLRTETSTAQTTSLAGYSLTLQVLGESDEASARQLEALGPKLIDSLRRSLQASEDRRSEERFPLRHPVEVFPLLENNQFGDGVLGETFNISRKGIGLVLPFEPTGEEIGVQIHSPLFPGSATLAPGQIAYVSPRNDGRYCVGVRLLEVGANARAPLNQTN